MDHNTIESEMTNSNTDTGAGNAQDETQAIKRFTQEEVNDIVERRIRKEQSKYSGVDISEYQELKSAKEKADTDRLMKRNEFDKILQQQKEKYDAETTQLRQKLESIQVDGALIASAANNKAVNPQHIASLLRDQVKLDNEGNVYVHNSDGEVVYNQDTASPTTIDDLVKEFVNSNPYFMSASPAGTGSTSNTANTSTQSVDLESLDLTRAEHRAMYREMRAKGQIE